MLYSKNIDPRYTLIIKTTSKLENSLKKLQENHSGISRKQAGVMELSVIIPTYNAAETLGATITALRTTERTGISLEVIIVDAYSDDETANIANSLDAKVIYCKKGRGPQLIKGAKMARSDWLLFLHADTILSTGWDASVVVFTAQENSLDRAAVFTYALNNTSKKAQFLSKMVQLRNRWLGLPYGDQGLLINRRFYRRIGGYRDWPIMEDVDLVRRIGMSRITLFDTEATTSAKRYIDDGFVKRIVKNFYCLLLYFLGFSPNWISRIYEKKEK